MNFPKIGIGTWQIKGEDAKNAVKYALKYGYRHVDTAKRYYNEKEVGDGIKESGVNREDIFLTTKIRMDDFPYDKVFKAVEDSLEKLQTSYVDLLLMHWPSKEYDHKETLKAMMELKKEGKIKNIGVSNFTIPYLKEALEVTNGDIFTNQVEYHVFLDQNKLLNYCIENNVYLTAYSPLSNGQLLDNNNLKEIAKKHGKTVPQIVLKWLVIQEGVTAVPRSTKEEHIKQNINIFDFELYEDDIKIINNLPKDKRLLNPPFAPEWD